MHGCVLSTVVTDALVLKHQAISIHGAVVVTDALVLKHQAISVYNVDGIFIVLDQFHAKIFHL